MYTTRVFLSSRHIIFHDRKCQNDIFLIFLNIASRYVNRNRIHFVRFEKRITFSISDELLNDDRHNIYANRIPTSAFSKSTVEILSDKQSRRLLHIDDNVGRLDFREHNNYRHVCVCARVRACVLAATRCTFKVYKHLNINVIKTCFTIAIDFQTFNSRLLTAQIFVT